MVPLAIAAGITAYFYIFLFMTIAATLGVYFLVLLWLRNWAEFRRACMIGAIAIGVSLPHIVYTYLRASQEFYTETLVRISFFSSHWPQIEAYYYGRWIVLALLLTYLLHRFYPKGISRTTHFFTLMTGTGLLLAMVSNVFIGKDFMIAFHVAKLGVIWYLVIAVVMLPVVYTLLVRTRGIWLQRLFVGFLFALLLLQMLKNVERSVPHFSQMKEEFTKVQHYAGVLDWLKSEPEGVVLAPEDLNSYIPTLTKQYTLYNAYGAQFTVSDDEVWERYLLYHAFDGLTAEKFSDPSGTYPFGHTPGNLAKISALQHRLCTIVREDCSTARETQDFIDIIGMQKKYLDYYPHLTANIIQEYAKYHVRYVVSKTDESHALLGLPLCSIIYHDQWFEVCTLAPWP